MRQIYQATICRLNLAITRGVVDSLRQGLQEESEKKRYWKTLDGGGEAKRVAGCWLTPRNRLLRRNRPASGSSGRHPPPPKGRGFPTEPEVCDGALGGARGSPEGSGLPISRVLARQAPPRSRLSSRPRRRLPQAFGRIDGVAAARAAALKRRSCARCCPTSSSPLPAPGHRLRVGPGSGQTAANRDRFLKKPYGKGVYKLPRRWREPDTLEGTGIFKGRHRPSPAVAWPRHSSRPWFCP